MTAGESIFKSVGTGSDSEVVGRVGTGAVELLIYVVRHQLAAVFEYDFTAVGVGRAPAIPIADMSVRVAIGAIGAIAPARVVAVAVDELGLYFGPLQHVGPSGAVVKGNGGIALLAFFGGDDDHAVSCTSTVEGCGGGTLEDGDVFDVVGIEIHCPVGDGTLCAAIGPHAKADLVGSDGCYDGVIADFDSVDDDERAVGSPRVQ